MELGLVAQAPDEERGAGAAGERHALERLARDVAELPVDREAVLPGCHVAEHPLRGGRSPDAGATIT